MKKKKLILIPLLFTVLTLSSCGGVAPEESESQQSEKQNFTGISFIDQSFVYDGLPHSIQVDGAPSFAQITYINNNKVEIGTYVVTAIINANNYNTFTISANLTITDPSLLNFEGISFEDNTFIYNGMSKYLTVVGAPSFATITYEGNNQIEVGVYTVKATISAEGYNDLLLTATLTIVSAEKNNFTGIVFNDKSFEYDGKAHSIYADNVPNFASKTYTGNGKIEPGKYLVSVKISASNYNDLILTAYMTINEPKQEEEYSIQDGNILHVWDWSMNNIISELDNIKSAGFNTIQISPMQPHMSYSSGDNWKNNWWRLYQPLGFSVASKNNENLLGTKDQLISLCAKAEEKGIKVIVDVVTNHLAQGNTYQLSGSVKNYEPDIYNNNLIHTLNRNTSDSSIELVVRGNLGGLPDLQTETDTVQNRVISMLEEYIDCGIDGFRFDAAKHIETPEDGDYASNFWPNIINNVNEYAVNKGVDKPYMYGEILNTCGVGRSYDSYTSRGLSVTDSTMGDLVLGAVKTNQLSPLTSSYKDNLKASNVVLWAESHDTYANDEQVTTNISQDLIDKAYVIQASRAEASSLYFVRPSSTSNKVGDIGTSAYKSELITSINNFHNAFINTPEKISVSYTSGCFINIRGKDSLKGAVVVKVNTSASSNEVELDLPDGSYSDIITGTTYTIKNSKVSLNYTNDCAILIPSNMCLAKPSISINAEKLAFTSSTSVTINVAQGESMSYQINGGNSISFTNSTTFNVGNNLNNGKINIVVSATNSLGSSFKSLDLYKTSLANKKLIIVDVPTDNYKYSIWSWNSSGIGAWSNSSKENNLLGYDFTNDNFTIVKMNATATNDWQNCLEQTSDLYYSTQVINYNSLVFSSKK